jgi:hypothetical protein
MCGWYTASDHDDITNSAPARRSRRAGQRHTLLVSGEHAGHTVAPRHAVFPGSFPLCADGISDCAGVDSGSGSALLGSTQGRGRWSFAGRQTLARGPGPAVSGCVRGRLASLEQLRDN